MIPEFDINIPTDTSSFEVTQQPSRTYRDRTKSIAGYVDSIEAIKQTVMHILNTERYAYPIYPDWYGMEFEKYIGETFEYFQATIANDLREALTQDDRIYNVEVDQILKLSMDSAYVSFIVYTTEGTIEGMEAEFGL